MKLGIPILLVLLLAGCAGNGGSIAGSKRVVSVVAQDFVHVFKQIPEVAPTAVTLQLDRSLIDNEPLWRNFVHTFTRNGYKTEQVSAGDGDNRFWVHTFERQKEGTGLLVYEVGIGSIGLRREYIPTESGKVKPLGTMYVKGAELDSIDFDESLWSESARDENTDNGESNPATGTLSTSNGIGNLAVNDRSVFEDELLGLVDVDERILVFPEATADLDPDYGKILKLVAEQFEQDSDLVYLVACSIAELPTLEDAERLAIDRIERVRAQLVEAGIPDDRIRTEGCWSDAPGMPHMPRHGVVLTLKRKP